MRISDPIVDFAETTDWFAKEVDNYTAFFDDPSPRLRQTTIPPYNEEEGIAFARHGRTRSILSGRCAAISVRVVPLKGSVFRSLQERKVVSDEMGCEEDILELGRALNCHGGDSQLSAESVLNGLLDALCTIDEGGNVLLESAGLRDGNAVYGVESAEVYVPSTGSMKDEEMNDDEVEKKEDGPATTAKSFHAYESLRSTIRIGGLNANREESGPPARTDADIAANEIWAKVMKGSAVAGFQLAVRAGPICEEPMRNVMVVMEGVEVAVTKSNAGKYKESKPLSGGMVVSALRVGIRLRSSIKTSSLDGRSFAFNVAFVPCGLRIFIFCSQQKTGKGNR